MITDTFISGFDLVIFLGVFQGIFLSWFFIRSGRKEVRANLYQGLLILALSMSMFEELLNNTGYIVQVLSISISEKRDRQYFKNRILAQKRPYRGSF